MKTAIYYVDGTAQVVLTAETEIDEIVLGKIEEWKENIQIYNGSFYECRGGWYRQQSSLNDKSSTIIRFNEKKKGEEK